MGVHGLTSNRKGKSKKGYSKFKKNLVKKHKAIGASKVSEINDPELMTAPHLRKRKTNSRTNITLSGKKKNKLLKKLKHAAKESSNLEEIDLEEGSSSTKKVTKAKFRDVEMAGGDLEDDQQGKSDDDEQMDDA